MARGHSAVYVFILFCLGLACSGKKETARSLMKQWCVLKWKFEHTQGEAKKIALEELVKFEQEMDRKYHRTDPIMREAQEMSCEDVMEKK